jgi:hypothetical protein
MSDSQSRRAFLATTGITLASVLAPRSFAQPKGPATPATPGTRESVLGMGPDHPTLVAYRTAIDAMKKLPATDPTSWQFQANMHGLRDGEGENQGWRWCMHGNWWFLPWHRGYLYFFEKIVRKKSGSDAFRLPYWPWEKDAQAELPAPFRDAKYQDQDNALYDKLRVAAANNGDPLRPDPQAGSGSFADDWSRAHASSRFTSPFAELAFGGVRKPKTMLPTKPDSTRQHGAMEAFAHDLIHDAVGGDGDMGDPDTAARDPIFWLHHANVDRLWNRWLDVRGHELPDPAADKDWYDQEFPYYDEDGKQVTVSVSKILELAGKDARYDDDRVLFAAAPPAAREKAVEPKALRVGGVQPRLELGTKPLTKTLDLAEEMKPKLMKALAAPRAIANSPVVLLRVEGLKPPKDAAVRFDVFLTKKGEKPSKASYVGPISFFGRRGGHGHADDEGFTQGFDVTDLVQKLRTANNGTLPELDVSVVPHSTKGLSDADLAKQNLAIPISDITLKLVTVDQK